MIFKRVPLNTLVPSPYNPPSRERKVEELARNIKEYGLLVPIIVSSDLTVVDGHRRTMAFKLIAKQDGKKESEVKVPIIQHNSDSDAVYDSMFISANKDTMLINGNQYLWRYMNGASVDSRNLSRIRWIEKALGATYAKGMFARILERGQSASSYQMSMGMYCRYTNTSPTNKADMRKLAYYMLNVESSYRVKTAIAHFIPIDVLKECVKENKKIEASFSPSRR